VGYPGLLAEGGGFPVGPVEGKGFFARRKKAAFVGVESVTTNWLTETVGAVA